MEEMSQLGAQLLAAVHEGRTREVERLVEVGADVNSKDREGLTALMVASQQGQTEVVEALVRLKADVNAKTERGQTALMLAAERGFAEVVEELVGAGAEPNVADKDGCTPLLKAAQKRSKDVVQFLLQQEGVEAAMETIRPVDEENIETPKYVEHISKEVLSLKDRLHAHTQLLKQLADNECPRTFIILPEQDVQHTAGLTDVWSSKAVTWLTSPLEEKHNGSWLDRIACDCFRLFLVCELSGQPVGEGYPINRPKEWIKSLAPVLNAGFRLVWLVNSTVRLAKVVAPAGEFKAADSVPAEKMDEAKRFLMMLPKEEEAQLGMRAGELQTQVGVTLRELQLFLEEHDKKKEWGGLSRHYLEDGLVLWASQDAVAKAEEFTASQQKAYRGGIEFQLFADGQPQRLVREHVLLELLKLYKEKQRLSNELMAAILKREVAADDSGISGAAKDACVQDYQDSDGSPLPGCLINGPKVAVGVDRSQLTSVLDATPQQLLGIACVPQLDGLLRCLADIDPVEGERGEPDALYYLPDAAINLPLEGRFSLALALLSCGGPSPPQSRPPPPPQEQPLPEEHQKDGRPQGLQEYYYLSFEVIGPIGKAVPSGQRASNGQLPQQATLTRVDIGLGLPAGSTAAPASDKKLHFHPVDPSGQDPCRRPLAPVVLAELLSVEKRDLDVRQARANSRRLPSSSKELYASVILILKAILAKEENAPGDPSGIDFSACSVEVFDLQALQHFQQKSQERRGDDQRQQEERDPQHGSTQPEEGQHEKEQQDEEQQQNGQQRQEEQQEKERLLQRQRRLEAEIDDLRRLLHQEQLDNEDLHKQLENSRCCAIS